MANLALTLIFLHAFLLIVVISKPTYEEPVRITINRLTPDTISTTKHQGQYLSHPDIKQTPTDSCKQDEVLYFDGDCYELLSQGPCAIDEFLILNSTDDSPYCAHRLCFPGMIYVSRDQLCHDPRDQQVCPPERQLRMTMYGDSICQCIDGFYEVENDENDFSCEPLLRPTPKCPQGESLWFRDPSRPPECLSDVCYSYNANRSVHEPPFVPSTEDKCFQLGFESPICPQGALYTFSFGEKHGSCIWPEEGGHLIFNHETLIKLGKLYGTSDNEMESLLNKATMPISSKVIRHRRQSSSSVQSSSLVSCPPPISPGGKCKTNIPPRPSDLPRPSSVSSPVPPRRPR